MNMAWILLHDGLNSSLRWSSGNTRVWFRLFALSTFHIVSFSLFHLPDPSFLALTRTFLLHLPQAGYSYMHQEVVWVWTGVPISSSC
jgi:hypothetical protein